ncbi:unnamed protein product [Auanema sp. JU1783]|nr:unnamed protein product [Auanema sp. JU1783]
MVHYKLTYFDGRGLGEISRQLFHLAETPFEDVRLNFEQFGALKSTFPFEQVPVLEVDGQVIPQSIAVARYLAKKFDFYGKCPYEQAIVDAIADQYKDFYVEMKPYYYSAIGVQPVTPDELKKLETDVLVPARDKFLRYMTNYLKKSSSGFLAGGSLTFADLIVAEHVSTILTIFPAYVDSYPEVKTHLEKVHAVPLLKKWLDSRPVTKF